MPHEQCADVCQLLLAADEGRRGHRQVGLVQRLERRELGLSELEDALGSREILEPMLAEVLELEVEKTRRRG